MLTLHAFRKDELRMVLEVLKDDVIQEDIPEMLADLDLDDNGDISFEGEYAGLIDFSIAFVLSEGWQFKIIILGH